MRTQFLFAVVISSVWSVFAAPQGDVVALGTTLSPLPTPDVSVLGLRTSTIGDVNVIGLTVTVPNAPASTETLCYGEGSVRVAPTATVDDPSVQCWLVYEKDGGIVNSPIINESATGSKENKNITVVLPIVVSLVGFFSIVAGVLLWMRYRAVQRRTSESRRSWVQRPGGWNGAEKPEVAQVSGSKGVTA